MHQIVQDSVPINYIIQFTFQVQTINYVLIAHKREKKLRIIHVFNLNQIQAIYQVVLLQVLSLV